MNLTKISWSCLLVGSVLLNHALAAPTTLNTPLIPNEDQTIRGEGFGGNCRCLRDAEAWTGKYGNWYSASRVPANSGPRVGAIALMYYSGYPLGHAAAVIGVTGGTITIRESGYYGCSTVDTRTISRKDPHLRGYYW